jgi:outer membrane protein W
MLRSITKLVAAAVIVLGFAGAAQAQTEADIIRPLTKQGSAAMMFTLGGIGTFGIGGPSVGPVGGAGMKYFFSDDMALRVLIGFSNSSSGADSTFTGTQNTGKEVSTNLGIGAGVEWHFRPLYSTTPYVGAQLTFATQSRTNTTGFGTTAKPDVDVKNSQTDIGVGLFAGFDWFFTRGLALGGEVNAGFSTGSSATTNGSNVEITNPRTTNISVGTSGSVHLIVYF